MAHDDDLPLVTVGLTTYNGERTVARALESLISQDWPNLEIIVSDDASSDKTLDICRSFSKRYEQIRLIENKTNLGDFGLGNLRANLAEASGKYYIWMCQDDVLATDFITRHVEAVQTLPGSVGALSAVEYFWQGDGVDWRSVHHMSERYWPQNLSIAETMWRSLKKTHESNAGRKILISYIIHGLIEADLFKKSIPFVSSTAQLERQIVALWALAGKFVYIDEALYKKESPEMYFTKYGGNTLLVKIHNNRENQHKNISVSRVTLHKYVSQTIKAILNIDLITRKNKFIGIVVVISYFIYIKIGRGIKMSKRIHDVFISWGLKKNV